MYIDTSKKSNRSSDYWEKERRDKANEFYAPVKTIKGASEEEKQRSKAADDLYSHAVSSVREPIEALFSWLNEKTNIQRACKCRSTCGLIASVFAVIFANGCYFVFCHQEKSMQKIQQGKELNLCIYTMHMAVWMLGWPLSPEAAKECFLLHFPQKDTIEFKTTNAIYNSPKIENAIKSLSDRSVGTSITVAWNGNKDYALNSPEHRAAIALNPCKITRVETPEWLTEYNRKLYDVKITSPMIYPKYSRTEFNLGKVTIIVHEGLFRYLQDRGWLSKYIAEYNATNWSVLSFVD